MLPLLVPFAQALLDFVCEPLGQGGQAALAFSVVTVCEALAKTAQVKEDLVSKLLPHILAALKGQASLNHRAAAYMVIAQLASATNFSAKLVSGGWTHAWQAARWDAPALAGG